MGYINYIINNNYSLIIILLTMIILLLIIVTLVNSFRLKRLTNKYYEMIKNVDSGNLEKTILSYYEKINYVEQKNKDIQENIQKIEGRLDLCAQKIGIIRYNAFDDVGSDLSFAIAVLDKNDNGFIINGIYSRETSTAYGKPIVQGKSKYPLSAEEIQALDVAKKSYNERMFISC